MLEDGVKPLMNLGKVEEGGGGGRTLRSIR